MADRLAEIKARDRNLWPATADESWLIVEVERLRKVLNDGRAALVAVLVYHQRFDAGHCGCGWGVLGASHVQHVADVYEMELVTLAGAGPTGDTP